MKKTLAAIAAVALLGMAPVCAFAEEEAAPVEAPVAEAALETEEEAPLAEDAPIAETEAAADADAAETTAPADVAETTTAVDDFAIYETKTVHFAGNAAVAPFDMIIVLGAANGSAELLVSRAGNVVPGVTSISYPVDTAEGAAAKTIDDYFVVVDGVTFKIVSLAFGGEATFFWNGTEILQAQVPFETTPAQTNVAPAETTTAAETATTAAAAQTTAAAATDKKDDGKKDEEKKDDDSPDTGDSTSALPLILGAAAALTGAATIVRRKQD